MSGWIRYSMWDRWRDLTSARLACEMALAYRTDVNDFPVTSDAPLTLHDSSGDSGYKCSLDEFKLVINDDEALYRSIYPSCVASVEDLAREPVERLAMDKRVDRSAFAGIRSSVDPRRSLASAAAQIRGLPGNRLSRTARFRDRPRMRREPATDDARVGDGQGEGEVAVGRGRGGRSARVRRGLGPRRGRHPA